VDALTHVLAPLTVWEAAMQTPFFQARAMITFLKSDGVLAYPACPTEGCNKKVTEEGTGQWHCEKCQKTYPACVWRYSLQVQVSDHTGSAWVTMFNNEAEQVFGVRAEDLVTWRKNNDPAFEAAVARALFQERVFAIRAREETFNDEQRQKLQVNKVHPIEYVRDARALLNDIRQQYLPAA
jgi:replication factor A1